MANNSDAIDPADLRTIEALAAELPSALTINTLRYQVLHRHENGLATACVRVGKRVLVSRSRYSEWLARRADKAAA